MFYDSVKINTVRILILTPDITPNGIARSYNTGFSLMVNQIACALAARGDEVYVSASSLFHPGLSAEVAGYRLLPRSLGSLLRHSRLRDWWRAVRYALTSQKLKAGERYMIAKYTVSTGFNEHLIRSIRPDVVSVQSMMPAVFPFILASLRCQVPFAVSLHGVFSFLHAGFGTCVEQNILKLLVRQGTEVTFVSSGTRSRLAECYGRLSDNMKVVLNALPPVSVRPGGSGVRKGCIVSVGNLCERKNQWQTLMAYSLLPEEVRKRHALCFIGKDGMDGRLQREAEARGLAGQVIFTGVLTRPEAYAWVEQAALVVLASKDEGFGLSLIEGFRFGMPGVCFSDIDAYKDIASPDALLGVDERTDEALALGMQLALGWQWDKEAILRHAARFTDEKMAEAYHEVFRQARLPQVTADEFTSWMDRYVLQSCRFTV